MYDLVQEQPPSTCRKYQISTHIFAMEFFLSYIVVAVKSILFNTSLFYCFNWQCLLKIIIIITDTIIKYYIYTYPRYIYNILQAVFFASSRLFLNIYKIAIRQRSCWVIKWYASPPAARGNNYFATFNRVWTEKNLYQHLSFHLVDPKSLETENSQQKKKRDVK